MLCRAPYLSRAVALSEERNAPLSLETRNLLIYCDKTAIDKPTEKWVNIVAEAAILRSKPDAA